MVIDKKKDIFIVVRILLVTLHHCCQWILVASEVSYIVYKSCLQTIQFHKYKLSLVYINFFPLSLHFYLTMVICSKLLVYLMLRYRYRYIELEYSIWDYCMILLFVQDLLENVSCTYGKRISLAGGYHL